MKPTETPCLQAIPSENKTSLPMSMEREAGSRHSAAHPKPHWSQSLLDLLGPSHFSPAQAIVRVKTQLPLPSCCSDSSWLSLCSPDHHWSLLNSSSIHPDHKSPKLLKASAVRFLPGSWPSISHSDSERRVVHFHRNGWHAPLSSLPDPGLGLSETSTQG